MSSLLKKILNVIQYLCTQQCSFSVFKMKERRKNTCRFISVKSKATLAFSLLKYPMKAANMGGKCCKKSLFCCCAAFCCKGRKIGGVSERDMTWMLNHTQYDEREIRQLYLGKSLAHSLGDQNEKESLFGNVH